MDEFGNVFINIDFSLIKDKLDLVGKINPNIKIINYKNQEKFNENIPFVKTFTDVHQGKPLLCDDSYGYFHLGLNFGDFKSKYNIKVGDKVQIEF